MSTLPLWASGVIGAAVFFALMFLRLHVGLSMMVGGFVGFWLTRGLLPAMSTVATTAYEVSSSPILVIIPLFMAMGLLAGSGGIIEVAFQTFYRWLGHLRGGLAMATVGACAAFGAVCGDNIATAMVMNRAALPEMRKYGYDDKLSFGAIAAGGNLGILIPPSAAFVIFGFITETPIGELFISGIIPGLLLVLLFSIQIAIQCKINPNLSSRHPGFSWKERFVSLKGLIGIAIVFALVMGGLMFGLFTPTEAGAAGAVAVILVSLPYRKLTLKAVWHSLRDAVRLTCMVLLLVVGARYFSYFITSTELAKTLADAIATAGVNKYLVMLAFIALLFVLGMIMDIWSVMIITLPIFFPILVDTLGFSYLALGAITVLCIMIGCISPPVGVVVFSVSGMHPDVPMYRIFRGVIPFVITMLILLLLLVFIPPLTTWLPGLIRY